eukprot:TRINITY_DN8856_c0_g1_i2.p1 TRINITY_DN8856_c0_g1~~TRINITY_DN8856_c0_g1_i2.p1  ORF type:complete len:247 (-),score=54.88 TRINITY_DN8856_c0_g1_i2:299-1039(-)
MMFITCAFLAFFVHSSGAQNGGCSDPRKLDLLTPDNSILLYIDYQPQMFMSTAAPIDVGQIRSNAVALAESAKAFGVPTIYTTVETESFSGYMLAELLDVFPEIPLLERTSMNSWDDYKVRQAVADTGRNKIIMGGLWTEVCINMASFSAMKDGYEVYVVEDAVGGTSELAHRASMDRMIQAGVVPVTWQQVLLEWQRDWANKDTYNSTLGIAMEYGGAYGVGIKYAFTMVRDAPQDTIWTGEIVR